MLLIKMDCACVCVFMCVCVYIAWFSFCGNCMPSQTTAIKWALVNWQLKDERRVPGFEMGISYTQIHTHTQYASH